MMARNLVWLSPKVELRPELWHRNYICEVITEEGEGSRTIESGQEEQSI